MYLNSITYAAARKIEFAATLAIHTRGKRMAIKLAQSEIGKA
jgi:hypothetical protein